MNPSPADIVATSRAAYTLSEPFDRGHDQRSDAAWLAARLADPSTDFVPVWRLDNLVAGEPVRAAHPALSDVADLIPHAESITFLGLRGERACFALGLPATESQPLPGQWLNLRAVSDQLDPSEWAVLAYARAMVYWHQRCRFCGVCGSPTVSALGGHVRRCANAACGVEHYPRTDPAIIVLVMAGERCLLGRQGVWPAGRYSTLAGFVEPGESIEQAVAREVYEEAGVRLREARYFGSQAFPFPASLMLGFHAAAAGEDIHLNDGELADARWFTRQELKAALDAGTVSLPPRFAISHHLISAWYNFGAPAERL